MVALMNSKAMNEQNQMIQRRYEGAEHVPSQVHAMSKAAIQIQKVARGKLAGKKARLTRILLLLRVTKKDFHDTLHVSPYYAEIE